MGAMLAIVAAENDSSCQCVRARPCQGLFRLSIEKELCSNLKENKRQQVNKKDVIEEEHERRSEGT